MCNSEACARACAGVAWSFVAEMTNGQIGRADPAAWAAQSARKELPHSLYLTFFPSWMSSHPNAISERKRLFWQHEERRRKKWKENEIVYFISPSLRENSFIRNLHYFVLLSALAVDTKEVFLCVRFCGPFPSPARATISLCFSGLRRRLMAIGNTKWQNRSWAPRVDPPSKQTLMLPRLSRREAETGETRMPDTRRRAGALAGATVVENRSMTNKWNALSAGTIRVSPCVQLSWRKRQEFQPNGALTEAALKKDQLLKQKSTSARLIRFCVGRSPIKWSSYLELRSRRARRAAEGEGASERTSREIENAFSVIFLIRRSSPIVCALPAPRFLIKWIYWNLFCLRRLRFRPAEPRGERSHSERRSKLTMTDIFIRFCAFLFRKYLNPRCENSSICRPPLNCVIGSTAKRALVGNELAVR